MTANRDVVVIGGGHNGLVAAAWARCSTYQAGSATHGGGGVTGIPGRNVVRQIQADARAERSRAGVRASVPQRRAGAA
jgi:phytoene dehydrogenase-like protein